MAEILKVLSVFLICGLVFGKLGMPAAMIVFKSSFLKVFIVSSLGGITGNIVFTYISAALLRSWYKFRLKRGMVHKKKIFTPFNRLVIRIKKRFGLTGIAFITPLLLSTPLGAFIAERFYKDKKKVILYLSVATVFWSIALYFLILLFHDSIEGWLI